MFCVTYKPVKLWDTKVEGLEEHDEEAVEKRGIDSGQKVLQIRINASEHKVGESGEDKAWGWRRRSACWVGERLRVVEHKMKHFEFGHHCQGFLT